HGICGGRDTGRERGYGRGRRGWRARGFFLPPGRGPLFALRRVADRCLEASGYRVATTEDRLDIPLRHFLLEQRVGHRDGSFGARQDHSREHEIDDQDGDEPQPRFARRHRWLAAAACGTGLGLTWSPRLYSYE